MRGTTDEVDPRSRHQLPRPSSARPRGTSAGALRGAERCTTPSSLARGARAPHPRCSSPARAIASSWSIGQLSERIGSRPISSGHLGLRASNIGACSTKTIASDYPRIDRVTFDLGSFALSGMPPADGSAPSSHRDARFSTASSWRPRLRLAPRCANSSMVPELVNDGGSYCRNTRSRTRSYAVVTERARIVIGADGVNSSVQRAVKALGS